MPNWVDNLMRQQRRRIVFLRVPQEQVLGEDLPSVPIEPNQSYFQVSLCEMHLRDQRELWRNFIPLGLAVSDFYYGGEKQSIPFIVGNQMLRETEGFLEGAFVDFRNTQVAGPAPYSGKNVGLFIGLVRLEVKDLAADLFRLMGDVMGEFAGAGLTRYLELSKPLGRGLAELLGMKKVELRFGLRDEYNSRDGSPQQFRQGYLVYLNVPEGKISKDALVVKDGRLHRRSGDNMQPVDDYDYCLVKIEHLAERRDYVNLPFYPLWREVRKLLLAREVARAEWKRLELLQRIADSPDLTEDHREGLIQRFELQFAQLTRQSAPAGPATRGARAGTVAARDPGLHLQRTAARAENAGASKMAVRSLMEISHQWQQIPLVDDMDERLEAETIHQQLAALKNIRRGKPRPRELADAITLSALRRD